MDKIGRLEPAGGLVRCFTEFYLLPDLLRRYPDQKTRDQVDLVSEWAALLDEHGYNEDHVEDRFIPDDINLSEFMAEDAIRLCRRIRLIGPRGGLSPSGRRVARMGRVRWSNRDENASRILTRTLAEQIQEHYRGADELRLVDLLQSASAVLSSHGREWRDVGLDGMLLIEMESLLHWGSTNADEARRLVYRLPGIRKSVVDAFREDPEVKAGRETFDATDIADTLAEVHWRTRSLAEGSFINTMDLRATAMAMTFAQLLSPSFLLSPVQVLRPWGPGRDAT